MNIKSVQQTPWSYVLNEPTRLLVADDDPILREFASVHLSTPTTEVETVADGTAALAALRASRFDIALLDIDMPVLDGFAVLERIRSDPTLDHMPVIMLTGHEDIASIDHAFGLGASSICYQTRELAPVELSGAVRACAPAASLREPRLGTESVVPGDLSKRSSCRPAKPHSATPCARSSSKPAASGLGNESRGGAYVASTAIAAAALHRWSDRTARRSAPD